MMFGINQPKKLLFQLLNYPSYVASHVSFPVLRVRKVSVGILKGWPSEIVEIIN